MPRWLVGLGYATAVVLLVAPGSVAWAELVFPGWVFVLSAHILVAAFSRRAETVRPDDAGGGAG